MWLGRPARAQFRKASRARRPSHGTDGNSLGSQPVYPELVIPLVEVKIPPVDLHLAALEVGGLGAQRSFRRGKLSPVVEVDDQPVRILVADIEIANLRLVGLFLHAVARIRRQPAPRLD